MKKPLSILMLASLILSGCLKHTFEEAEVVLEPNEEIAEGLVVEADTFLGDPVLDTIRFVTNRSWSAKVVPAECDWITLGLNEEAILSHVSKNVVIPVSFADNGRTTREASIVISTGDEQTVIPVKQKALTPRLVLTSDELVSGITSDTTSVTISFVSNVDWTAQVTEDSQTAATLSKTSGTKGSDIVVKFPENDDPTASKTVKVLLKGEDCADVTVTMIQNMGLPYIRIENTTIDLPAGEGNIASKDPYTVTMTKAIEFKTNQSWKATADLSKFEGLTLSATEGNKTQGITLSYKANANPILDKTATILLETVPDPGVEKKSVTITVNQFGKLALYFSNGTANTLDSNLILKDFKTLPTSHSSAKFGGEIHSFWTNEAFTGISYEIKVYSDMGIWRNSKAGLQFKNSADDYIELPGINGYKITEVEMKHGSGTNINYACTDASGNVLDGGDAIALNKIGAEKVWKLSRTSAGQSVRIAKQTANQAAFDQIEVRYEKVTE